MQTQGRVLGVVLAGGRARRMAGADKPLLGLGAGALIDHVIVRVAPQVFGLGVSANGDAGRFARSRLPVLADGVAGFPGPLAGVLAGMRWAEGHADTLLTVPVDTPFLPRDLVSVLLAARREGTIVFARSGGRPHPVVALWPVALADALAAALTRGQRAVAAFAADHGAAAVDFPDPAAFFNVNTPDDLIAARHQLRTALERRMTAQLLLRRVTPSDGAFVVDLFARPALVAHRPDPRPDTAEESMMRLQRDLDHWSERGFGRWIAEQDGRPIGIGGVKHREGSDGPNLSYHFHPDAWGRGYASELAAEALDVAFGALAAHRVAGMVRPVNGGSLRVMAKAGFVVEGEAEVGGAPMVLLGSYR